MMTSYIEDKFLAHFFNELMISERFTEEGRLRDSFLDYLKSKTNIVLNSDLKNVLNLIEHSHMQAILPLITSLTTGRNGTTINKNSNIFRELKRLEIYSRLNLPFASFWLHKDSLLHPIDKYEQTNPYTFFSTENVLEKWKKSSFKEEFYVGPTNSCSRDIMKKWDEIKNFSHPLKDIIILDKYCLKDKIGIEKNIIPLIANLPIAPSCIKNVILFVKRGEIYENSLEVVHKIIKEKLTEIGISSNIIIYESDKTPHDRCVITNNIFITSGDSFFYFDEDGSNKRKGTLISLKPIFEVNNAFFDSQIKTIKEIYKNDKSSFYGEKSKNMLD